ncbi:MAG: hypothetical protein Q9169_004470 [Polycauliona sp. 2 TL-2023]
MIYTRDVENIKAILSAPLGHFVLGSSRGANFAPVAGHGLFTADGQAWQHYRACSRPFFTHAKRKSSIKSLETLLQQRWASLPSGDDGWTEGIELQGFFLDLTLDASLENLFGRPAHTNINEAEVDEGTPSKEAFTTSLDAAATFVGDRTTWGKMFWMKQTRDFEVHGQTIRNFIDYHVAACQKRGSRQLRVGEAASPGHQSSTNEQQHHTELRNRIQPLLFTGRNAVGGFLAITIFFLGANPAIYRKLRMEILSRFGSDGDIALTELDTCQYLQFCILESLRLGNVVPAIMRSAEQDLSLPRGGGQDKQSPTYVPQGSTILLCIQAMHLRKDFHGIGASSRSAEVEGDASDNN